MKNFNLLANSLVFHWPNKKNKNKTCMVLFGQRRLTNLVAKGLQNGRVCQGHQAHTSKRKVQRRTCVCVCRGATGR